RGATNGTRFWLTGRNASPSKLVCRGTVTAAGLEGTVRLRSVRTGRLGTLTLTRRSAGADLFMENCAPCHGADARGLQGRPDIHLNHNIPAPARNGRSGSIGVMPAFPNLTDADIADIQSYLEGLCPVPTGAELLNSNCAACHGTDASGRDGRPDIRCTVRSRVFNAVRTGRGDGLMPIFSSAALSDNDVETLLAYLAGLAHETPAPGFPSNCVPCHGATAGGGRNANGVSGPDIRCTGANDFADVVRFGSDAMPPFPELSGADVGNLALYVQDSFCGP